jgi:polyhydroxyalkanoate synthesis regulator phasin
MGYKSENWIGSDGENVLLRPVDLGLDGTRIKSATGNRGTFDPANPDIRFSRREPVEPIPDAQTVEQKIERAQSVADAFQMAARAFPDAADMVAYIVDEGKLSKTEAQSVADALQREVRKRTLSGLNENSVDEVSQVAKELGDQELFDAWREKRNTLLNQAARERIKATNANAVKGLEGSSKIAEIEGIKASLAGTKYINIEGGRKSLERSMIDRMGQAHTDLIAALEREGLREKFVNDEMEEDIAKARWALSTEDQKGLEGLRPDAVKIARIMEDLQESGRIAKNERGAWIGKAEGYMFRRSWDRYAFSPDKRAKFDEIFGKQNWEKVFSDGREDTPEARQAWLDGVWHSLSTGEHERASDEDLRPMSGPRNIAKKMSQHRTIHFQDALAELGAIREFGASQTLRNAFIGELAKTSRDIALLDHLGPNPEANLQKVIEEIRSSIPPDRRQKFEDHQASVMDLFHTLDGTNNIAENKSLATIGRRWRAYMSMNLLTGALFSQFSDLATGGIALRRRVGGAGKNPFSVLTYQARQIAGLMQGRKSTKKQAILREVGFVYDHLLAGMHDAIGLRDLGRAFGQGPSDEAGRGFDQSKLMKLFFKVNGMQWWVDSSKSTSLLMAMHDMDGLSAKAYEGLPRQTQLWLGSHDIGPLEWETIRKGGRKAADGSRYLTPEGVRSLPDAIADEAERERVASLYQGAIRELGEKANIEPGARVKSAVNIGTRPGTVIGEAVRAGMQFKGFSFAYLQDVLGEEVYGQGYNTLGQMLRKGKGDMVGIAYLVAMSTIYGYASMYCKDLIKGKKPRDPESPKTAMAAMLQGGGAGLYGDFLFGEKSRFGSSALESALGPTYGFAKGLIDIKENARPAIGETMPLDKRARRVGVGVLDMTTRYTPFLNLFYVRPVMDFLIFNQAKDALAPGYFRRRQAQIKRDNDQEVQPWFGKSLGGN